MLKFDVFGSRILKAISEQAFLSKVGQTFLSKVGQTFLSAPAAGGRDAHPPSYLSFQQGRFKPIFFFGERLAHILTVCVCLSGGMCISTRAGDVNVSGQAEKTGAGAQTIEQYAHKIVMQIPVLHNNKDYLAERIRLQYLYFLTLSTVGKDFNLGVTSGKLLLNIDSLNASLTRQWSQDLPVLDKKLDLIIRNKPVAQALADLALAAGMKIELLPGSEQDSCRLLGTTGCQVVWLDLRGVDVAQALDRMTRELRLEWRAEKDHVVVGSQRLFADVCAWIYDVSPLVHPSEIFAPGLNEKDRWEAFKRGKDEFLISVKVGLALKENAVQWYAPGQLLIFADQKTHAAAGVLISQLADPNTLLPPELEPLHKLTTKRYAENKGKIEEHLRVRQRDHVMKSFGAFSWKLLAAAADARLDLEALTELQAAWNSPEAISVVNGSQSLLALRSAFVVTQSARALKNNQELVELAEKSSSMVREAGAKFIEELTSTNLHSSPSLDESAALKLIYAALLSGDVQMRERARAVFEINKKRGSASSFSPILGELLLGNPANSEIIRTVFERNSQEIRGEDHVVLMALACQRAGHEAWELWRENARDILGGQHLPGSVVVLVNNLGK